MKANGVVSKVGNFQFALALYSLLYSELMFSYPPWSWEAAGKTGCPLGGISVAFPVTRFSESMVYLKLSLLLME